ncbi:DUF7619 domain-containing protein [Hymenobacter wooponensis]|uniref:T9SS type A sorting domain-containing protein n=1 Tax=Hymenobacter wooponensis TaxID=1525360 RepID=A0A4Z0MVR8_9BACT|nr:IPT/TIG domain-containing protein [Hymenobacter wooponensis]TGD83317.1 T9SS type A sorting domain-containing protein [Hymenobacter wooponensis]
MRKRLLLLLLLTSCLSAFGQLREFRLERMLGTPLDLPLDIKLDQAGNMYVLDRLGITKLDPNGQYRGVIPLRSATRTPDWSALALDGHGSIYVVNQTLGFIRKYSVVGDSLTQFGTQGAGQGQLLQPKGAAVDAAGNIYVADSGNNRVQKFAANGQVVWVYAPGGSLALVQPTDVKLGPDNNVYVLNRDYTAVKLSPSGQLLNSLSLRVPGSTLNDQSNGMLLDASNNIYLVSSRLSYIQKYSPQGNHLEAFGSGAPTFYGIHAALGIDATGNVYAVDATDRDPSFSTIRKYSATGSLVQQWGNEAVLGNYLRLDQAGNLYYYDAKQQKIVRRNPAGLEVGAFGSRGSANGQFNGPVTSIALDALGNVYALESGEPRIQKFDAQGRFLSKIPLPNPQTNPNGYWPTDLAVDAIGNLYVLDHYSGVRKYSPQGQFLQNIGAGGSGSWPGPGPGKFYAPRGVLVDIRGNVYVLDGAGSRVQKFTSTGQLIREVVSVFPPSFTGSASLSPYDAGFAVDGAGNIYASVGKDDFVTMYAANSSQQKKLPVRANLLAINSNGTRLVTGMVNNDVLRFYTATDLHPANLITGRVYQDLNNNCTPDPTEPGLPNMVIVAEPGNYYGLSDENGNYSIEVDTGTFVLRQIVPTQQPGHIVQPLCSNSVPLRFTSYGTSVVGPDFGDRVSAASYLTINVAGRRRRCARNVTTVSYANIGYAAASNAVVKVALPQYVNFLRANVPHTRDAAGNYLFEVGTLQPNQRGIISIEDSVSCGNTGIRGLTLCTKAWITPGNTYPTSSGWDQASLTVSGHEQAGNQVRFVVRNSGLGATTDSVGLRIYQDAQLALQRNISLASRDSLVFRWTATGPVVRIETDQPDQHPTSRVASATVELPGLRTSSAPSPAMMAMPPAETAPEMAEDCQPILDSYDPNDKQVVPVGVTAQHFTPTNQALRYQVRFQNTGNDVAYRVVVVDTISADLDLSTLQINAASHSYRLAVAGQQRPVLTFTFDNIMLPDSASNPLGSNGLIQFSIRPKAVLAARTRIDNFADIFFDYNEPVRTNTTTNRIYDVPRTVDPAVALSYSDVLALPAIASVAPAEGRFGTLVTLTGRHFLPTATANRVVFDGVAAPVLSATATTLTVRVPAGATTGSLVLTTSDGTSRSNFTVFQPPTITDVAPSEGRPGTVVTVTGTHFSALAAQDTVEFNGVAARVLQASATTLQVEVPAGATLGKLRLRTRGGAVESPQAFMVWYAPTLTAVAPGRASVGATISLSGTNFSTNAARNVVTFTGGRTAQVLQQAASRSLLVKVPAGAQSGQIKVQTPGGEAMGAADFTVIPAPTITSFSPQAGTVGTLVTIEGRNFHEEGKADSIYFNGVAAQVLETSATRLLALVPRGASTGALMVSGVGGQGRSSQNFTVTALAPHDAVVVYPNPTQGDVKVNWQKADVTVQQVWVYDARGSLISSQTASAAVGDELTLPLARHRAGLYVVVVKTAKGRIMKRITVL